MFIGQRLGSQIPFGITYFIDASGNITAKANTQAQLTRYRILDPETIGVVANLDSGQQTINVFTGRTNISLSADCEPADGYIRQRLNSSDVTVTSLVGAIATITKLASPNIDMTTDVVSDEIRERNQSSDIEATLNLAADAIRAIYAQASSEVNTNVNTAAVRVRIGQSNIILTADLNSDEIRKRNQSSDIEAILNIDQIEVLRTIEGLASIDVNANVAEIDFVRERNVGSDIDVETVVDVLGVLVKALFKYSGDLAPGETIIIDTDDLTVENVAGDNLRKYLDGEWYKIDPDNTDNLTWLDDIVSRDIEFEVEKEDRSV